MMRDQSLENCLVLSAIILPVNLVQTDLQIERDQPRARNCLVLSAIIGSGVKWVLNLVLYS